VELPVSDARIRVLVVDDSAMIRSLLRSGLSQHPMIDVVGVAVDGLDALAKIKALRPDVVTLDIEMPQLNGIGVLERVVGKAPVSFVMVSTLTQAGARITFEALRKGAVDYVTKPQAGNRAGNAEFQDTLREKVLTAARVKNRPRRAASGPSTASAPQLPPNRVQNWVVAIGISCGGPQTLHEFLPAFPSDFVPIVLTQHMPAQFTGPFAQHLDAACAMHVVEAQAGQVLTQGTVYVAPGDSHLHIVRRGAQLVTALDNGPLVSGHRPSADAMFNSVAAACGNRAIGVVMTGMGKDGAAGVVAMSKVGAHIIAQDEATSYVYGMPKAAAETGCVDAVLPLPKIPAAIAQYLNAGIAHPARR
jgi:two-component system, chemotaxis family, protein-glutamate methylesterase/glutaminase